MIGSVYSKPEPEEIRLAKKCNRLLNLLGEWEARDRHNTELLVDAQDQIKDLRSKLDVKEFKVNSYAGALEIMRKDRAALRKLLGEAADVIESYSEPKWHETNLAENMIAKIRNTLNAISAD